MVEMTTGATHAPASSADTAPMNRAMPKLPFSFLRTPTLAWYFEKSIWMMSNMPRASTTKRMAMALLNQGLALMLPKALETLSTTTSPSSP